MRELITATGKVGEVPPATFVGYVLDIDPSKEYVTAGRRPIKIVEHGEVVRELFA